MPSLVYIAEDSQGVSYPLGKGIFSIGNSADAQLQLPSHQIVTAHATIHFEDGQYYLNDNGSETGSYVNGERITRVQLKHHDILRFGEYRFRMNLFDVVEPTPVLNPANMETSRIDLPPELVRRATRGLPSAADVRRVVESRPQSLKAAETSQIEPPGLPKKAIVGKLSDSAVVKRSVTVARATSTDKAATPSVKAATQPSLVVKEERRPLPAWVWFLLGAVLAAGLTAAVMHFLQQR